MSTLFSSPKIPAPVKAAEPKRDNIPSRIDSDVQAAGAEQAKRARKRRGRRSLITSADSQSPTRKTLG